MVKNRFFSLLFIIFFIALFLRFYDLSGNPPSLTWDEAAWGYNAYTLGIDGKDEFGRFLPYDYLESFGDFKPPLYAYLGVLPVKLFGLNELAVRFPSALLGSVTVLITFFLVKEIFADHRTKKTSRQNYSTYTALVASLILAISPWHILLSRAAFEANVATFFIVSGIWLFLYSLHKNAWFLCLSAACFVLSMYTFNTARIVAPLLVTVLAVGNWKELFRLKKQITVSLFIGMAMLLPIVPFLFSPQAQLRFKEVNIFSDISVVERSNQQIANDNNAWWSKVIHNRRVGYGIEFAKHYLENLTPNFLFIKGDGNPKFSIQTVGQMYLWEAPFLVIGVFLLFKKREGSWWIIPFWLVLGILPAATARETPHALRIEATLPTFQILVGYGLVHGFLFINKYRSEYRRLRIILYTLFSILYTLNIAYFLHGYYKHYPYEYSGEWQYGYKQSIDYVKQVENQYDSVYVTTDLGRPYTYYLFFLQIDPHEFRRTADVHRDTFGFVNVNGFGKYTFTQDLHGGEKRGNTLYVNSYKKMPSNATVKKLIHLLDGTPGLVVYTL